MKMVTWIPPPSNMHLENKVKALYQNFIKFKKIKLNYMYESTIKNDSSQNVQTNNSRFNTSINPNCPKEWLYWISNRKLVDVEIRDRLEDMICNLGQESFQQAHVPMYDTLESDSKKPLYLRCKNSLTLLLAVLSLVNVKVKYEWSDKSFTSLL